MIIDSLHNYKSYSGMHPRLAKAFEYLVKADFSKLPNGRNEIDGDEIFLMMTRGELKKPQDAPIEVHNRYIDIQLVIEGTETFGWRERSELGLPEGGFDAEKDVQFSGEAPSMFFTLHAGQTCVFFPEDGHAPMIGEGPITKCIVKILK